MLHDILHDILLPVILSALAFVLGRRTTILKWLKPSLETSAAWDRIRANAETSAAWQKTKP